MAKHTTTLANGTGSPFEVRSETSSGVHALLTIVDPKETYKLVRGSSDTYLLHWVVIGEAPAVSITSDELADNEKITIVRDGVDIYKKIVVPRHSGSPKRHNMLNGQRSQSVRGLSAAVTPNIGRPPSGFRRFLTSLIRRSPEAATSSSSSLRSVNSAPILDTDVVAL